MTERNARIRWRAIVGTLARRLTDAAMATIRSVGRDDTAEQWHAGILITSEALALAAHTAMSIETTREEFIEWAGHTWDRSRALYPANLPATSEERH